MRVELECGETADSGGARSQSHKLPHLIRVRLSECWQQACLHCIQAEEMENPCVRGDDDLAAGTFFDDPDELIGDSATLVRRECLPAVGRRRDSTAQRGLVQLLTLTTPNLSSKERTKTITRVTEFAADAAYGHLAFRDLFIEFIECVEPASLRNVSVEGPCFPADDRDFKLRPVHYFVACGGISLGYRGGGHRALAFV